MGRDLPASRRLVAADPAGVREGWPGLPVGRRDRGSRRLGRRAAWPGSVSRAKRRIPQAYLGKTRGERLFQTPLGSEAIVFKGGRFHATR